MYKTHYVLTWNHHIIYNQLSLKIICNMLLHLSFEPTLQMVFETFLGMIFYSSLNCKDDWKLFFQGDECNLLQWRFILHVSDKV